MQRTTLRLAAAAALATSLFACRSNDRPAETAAPREVPVAIGGNILPKPHQIPPGQIAAVRKLFSSGAMSYPISVVSAAGAQTQFVRPQPVFVGSDRFVLGAPLEFHAEIDRVLDGMAKSPPAPSSTYQITYWVIEAIAGPEEIPPDLVELAPTLQAVTGLGKRHFKSIDRVSTRIVDSDQAELKGRVIYAQQTLVGDPDGLRLKLKLELHGEWSETPAKPGESAQGPTLETTLQLQPDKPIVLGDSALAASSDGTANLLLYVVRVRRVD